MPKKPTSYLNPSKSHLAGLTLPEVIVSISILGIMSIVVSRFFIFSLQSGQYLEQQGDATKEANSAINIISAILREASDGDNGNYVISGAGDNSLGVYSDVDEDNSRELVLFELDGTVLKMITIQPSGNPVQYLSSNSTEVILTDNVVNSTFTGIPVFEYYNQDYPADTDNNPLSSPIDVTDITLIKTQLDVNINPSAAPESTRAETFTRLRNKN